MENLDNLNLINLNYSGNKYHKRRMKLHKFKTIEWKKNYITMLDQRKLPTEEKYIKCKSSSDVAKAIKQMVIRGAPAIGVAAAMGIALGARQIKSNNKKTFFVKLTQITNILANTRPTAANLFWAIKRMQNVIYKYKDLDIKEIEHHLEAEAINIYKEDIEICRKIGLNGSKLLKGFANGIR